MLDDGKIYGKKIDAEVNRSEERFSCLGIGLLYSINLNANLDNVGADIYRAQLYDMSLNGLSIDVNNKFSVGEKLRLCVEAPHGQREILLAETKWCRLISDNAYRLGLKIYSYSGAAEACSKSAIDGCYSSQLQAVPSEIRLCCPACEKRVLFEYLDEQQGLPGNGSLLLYVCPACGTTRSIATILQYNRKQE